MIRFVFGLAAAMCATPVATAFAADMPYAKRARYEERAYNRPIPRVYYQSARPTMVCRVAFLSQDRGWPKERGVARCTRLD